MLRWAWLRGSSPSSLTVSNRVGSGRLGRGNLLNPLNSGLIVNLQVMLLQVAS